MGIHIYIYGSYGFSIKYSSWVLVRGQFDFGIRLVMKRPRGNLGTLGQGRLSGFLLRDSMGMIWYFPEKLPNVLPPSCPMRQDFLCSSVS